MEKKNSISDAELEVAEILWQADSPLSAFEIRNRLNKTKQWERTTVLTLIRRLVDKQIIAQEKKDVYYYSPILEKEDYIQEETKQFINRLYKGNTKNLVAALFQDKNLTEKDINELKEYFNN